MDAPYNNDDWENPDPDSDDLLEAFLAYLLAFLGDS
jgi:hypothetical protein